MKKRLIEYDLPLADISEESAREKRPSEEPGLEKTDAVPSEEQYLEEKELEELEEYIQYYELIRERIKKYVSRNYNAFKEEGGVGVVFSLYRSGALKDVQIDKTKSAENQALTRAALKSVRDAAPFPAFPESLKKDELTFNISIIFQ